MIAVLLFRLCFHQSLVVAGVPGLVSMFMGNYFIATDGQLPLGVVVLVGLLFTYVPGLLLCLMTPHVTEKLHYKGFLLDREKSERLRIQSTMIHDQSGKLRQQSDEIAKTKEKLAAAQKIVDKVMEAGGGMLDLSLIHI